MRKSSIYLPEELKRRLAELASRSGRSEADLIRQAIERLLGGPPEATQSDPGTCPHVAPALVGVGVGPGDPQLITDRARATLRAADRVVAISTDVRSIGRAEMVVRAVCPAARIHRVGFDVAGDDREREASLEAVVAAVLAGTDAGELVALAVIGDPSQWTVFPDVAARVRPSRPDLTVSAEPGITSYQAVAAAAGVSLGGPGGAMTVLTTTTDLGQLLPDHGRGVVLYKVSTDTEAVRADAERLQRDGLVGELSGMPGQRLVPLTDTAAGPLAYLSTVVFPAAVPSASRRQG